MEVSNTNYSVSGVIEVCQIHDRLCRLCKIEFKPSDYGLYDEEQEKIFKIAQGIMCGELNFTEGIELTKEVTRFMRDNK